MPLFSLLRTLLILGRVSNLPTVWTNVAVGWFLSGGGWTAEFAWILLGMSLVYIAGMTLNDAFDAAWDLEHAPQRPIPAGKMSQAAVWSVGVIEMLAGGGLLAGLTSVSPLLAGGLVLAVLLYNALHKRWAGSVLIMGLCRSLVYLGAGSAVAAQTRSIEVPTTLLLIAGGVVVYIAGLTLAARQEHLAAPPALRRIPGLMLMLPVLFPLILWRTMPADLIWMAVALVGVLGVGAWLMIVRRALAERVPKGIAFAIAGIAFFDASVVAFANWTAAVACLAAFVLTLGLQRVIPAT
jgi:4-hydroxybenzoate polyprenyltransferase